MANKRIKGYDQEALINLGKSLTQASPRIGGGKYLSIQANIKGLEKAVMTLPKKDREIVERFWGLTGGLKHNKKIGLTAQKDVAFQEMFTKAVSSMRKLFTIDLVNMYDDNFNLLIKRISCKINKDMTGEISELEAIKYLVAFFVYIWNGPKMSFEDDPMDVDEVDYVEAACDEYVMLKEACLILDEYHENSFKLKLLVNFLQMLDITDMLVIKKSMGIEITEDWAKEWNLNQIEYVHTFAKVRAFKEKIFPYGEWRITSELIIGNTIEMSEFMEEVDKIRSNWSKIEEYKTGEKQIRISAGIRTLDVYNIGGLEFTDPYEVMFLYLERNLIEKIVKS